MNYDCIIAGGSFAGLAAANQIKRGRVLLIDRKGRLAAPSFLL